MFRCTTEQYDLVYAPWLKEPDLLLRLGGYKPGEHLLDLCGGTGAISKVAIHIGEGERGPEPNITLLDLNPRCHDNRVLQIRAGAEGVGELEHQSFDLVVCRQAMGYLDPVKVIKGVAFALKPGGRFVFNTFMRPSWCRKRTYWHDGSWYLEVHITLFGRVFHLQYRKGVGYDFSIFRYHSSDYLTKLLTPFFHIELQSHGRGLHWLCTRLPEKTT